MSQESVCYSFRVLSSMLQDAVQWQVIPSNPCQRVEAPKIVRKKVRIIDEESIGRMLEALTREPMKYRTIVMLGIDSGLRLGELMGLKWQDIDFEKATLSVTKANQALVGKGVFTKRPKNESSIRDVALSSSTLALLKMYQKEQMKTRLLLEEKWIDEGWVFTQWNGKPMYPDTPSHWFREFLARHGLPHMRFHALRHLSATVLIAQGGCQASNKRGLFACIGVRCQSNKAQIRRKLPILSKIKRLPKSSEALIFLWSWL